MAATPTDWQSAERASARRCRSRSTWPASTPVLLAPAACPSARVRAERTAGSDRDRMTRPREARTRDRRHSSKRLRTEPQFNRKVELRAAAPRLAALAVARTAATELSDRRGHHVDKLKMHSPDLTAGNIDKLAELFPTVVTETPDDDGNPMRAVDFDLLRQELSDHVVEGPQERYQLDWPGKREALFAANAPIAKTLRPCREESVDFDTTKNLFIEGDNLDALKLLQESYLGKVKLIYIDPPYNTGNDFVYDDDFAEDNR